MEEQNQPLHFLVISDSIGETAEKLAKAAIAQFPEANIVLHKSMFISNKETLDKALALAEENRSIIFLTIVDDDLAAYAEQFSAEHQLTIYNLIQPITTEITRQTGLKPSNKIGAQHDLSEEYFRRVEAMEFCMTYDDGKDPKGFIEADIVLLGISRTSKTPLSMYLGTLGYKVANLPLIPENDIPPVLFELNKNKIVGLTNNDYIINLHREHRMREYGMPSGTRYASLKRVNEELEYSSELYNKLGCFVINTAERSIEETASIIVHELNLSLKA